MKLILVSLYTIFLLSTCGKEAGPALIITPDPVIKTQDADPDRAKALKTKLAYSFDDLKFIINSKQFFKNMDIPTLAWLFRCEEHSKKAAFSYPAFFAFSTNFSGFSGASPLCGGKSIYAYKVKKPITAISLQRNSNRFFLPNGDKLTDVKEGFRTLALGHYKLENPGYKIQAPKVMENEFICGPLLKGTNVAGLADYDSAFITEINEWDDNNLKKFDNFSKDIGINQQEIILCNPQEYIVEATEEYINTHQ